MRGKSPTWWLRGATANVRTLRSSKFDKDVMTTTGVAVPGRAQLLEMQFRERGVHVVCIQEGRIQSDQMRHGVHYNMLIAGATASGQHGSQIWISNGLCYSTLLSKVVSPRLVLQVLRLKGGAVLAVFSGHAPIEATPTAEKAVFWEALWAELSSVTMRWLRVHLFLGIDANARLGSVKSWVIGDSFPDEESENGQYLRLTLERCGIVAANTFHGGEYTWCSSLGPTSRIDYVCTNSGFDCPDFLPQVCDTIELATTRSEDHRCVACAFLVTPLREGTREKSSVKKYDLEAAGDPHRRAQFEDMLWAHVADIQATAGLDNKVDAIVNTVHYCASAVLGPAPKVPRQPWVSKQTWALLRFAAPLRRAMHGYLGAAQKLRCQSVFFAWAALRIFSFAPGRPWRSSAEARARAGEASDSMKTVIKIATCVGKALGTMHYVIKKWAGDDKNKFYHEMAWRAAIASANNNAREAYRILRLLSGFSPRVPSSIKRVDGTLTTTEAETGQRWVEYFVELFKGRVVDEWRSTQTLPGPVAPAGDFRPTVSDIAGAVQRLHCGRACGSDGIPAELVKVGGTPLAVMIHSVTEDMTTTCAWPARWKGGRMATVWKKKGSPQNCADNRGLLVADALAKIPADLVKAHLQPAANMHMPESQYGGRAGGGTDFPAHTMRLILEYAATEQRSVAVVFFDLVQAFDRAIREIVLGWPQCDNGAFNDCDAKRRHLMQLGLTADAADNIADIIRQHGTVLDRWHVDPIVKELVKSLHTNAWFAISGASQVVVTSTGGRQGCKLGGTVFCAAYEEALTRVRSRLRDRGITLSFTTASTSPFWAPPPGDAACTDELVEATYVDDEAVAIVASSPRALRAALQEVVTAYQEIFAKFGLTLNWGRGKSEAMIQLRGSSASQVLDSLRADGALHIEIPGTADGNSTVSLAIVPRYKHLGGILDARGNMMPEARARCTSALSAYAPIAKKIFGAPNIHISIKLGFAFSLVFSRLFFNVATWTMTPTALAKLNTVYMRVLRRIAGAVGEGGKPTMSDRCVRERCCLPSIDCLVFKRRLLYYSRLARHAPPLVWALLQSRPKGKMLPYVQQFHADIARSVASVPALAGMPGIASSPQVWLDMLKSDPDWPRIISSIFFQDSILDKAPQSEIPVAVASFKCMHCEVFRPTRKAIEQHMRMKHGFKKPVKQFVDSSGICPICKTNFQQRLRVIAHLSDRRRPRCRERVLKGETPAVPEDVLADLERQDRELLRCAWREGSSHAIAVGSARTATGKRTGHVQR